MIVEFIGGPLDGQETHLNSEQGPFFIFETTTGINETYSCYKLEESKLLFVETKTREEMLKMT